MECSPTRACDTARRAVGDVTPIVFSLLVLAAAWGCSPQTSRIDRHAPPAPTSSSYDFSQQGAVLTAKSDAMSLHFSIGPKSLLVQSSSDAQSWSVELIFSRFGRDRGLRPAPPIHAAAEVQANQVRLSRRGGLDEWYVNGPRGLEQGFTVQRPPYSAAGGKLVVELTVRGASPAALPDDGNGLALQSADSRVALRYTDLIAHDALGRELPSSMHAEGQQIELRIDDREALYPIVIDPLVWQETGKLVASDGNTHDHFGQSLALDQHTAVIGAPMGGPTPQKDEGAAYVLVRSMPQSWAEQAKLLAKDGATHDDFGARVAVHADTVVVGAPSRDDAGMSSGAAYVFTRSGATWSQQAKLLADDSVAGDKLGSSVAIDGDTALIGASYGGKGSNSNKGAAYVFVRSDSSWTQQKKLLADNGLDDDWFGVAVALSGNTALVGAYNHNATGNESGAAYVFVRSGSTWTLQQELNPGSDSASDHFGLSVAIDGDTAIVGAPNDDDAADNSGAAHVFVRSGSTWTKQGKLTSPNGQPDDRMGTSVALVGDVAIVSARYDDDMGEDAGAAYLFEREGASWSFQAKLSATDGTTLAYFGSAVALSADSAIVGAMWDDAKGSGSGSAYAYQLALSNGSTCSDDDQCQSGQCVDERCCEGNCSARGAACNIGSKCASGLCVDGVCCNELCAGPCDSCIVEGTKGTCVLMAQGTTAQPSCTGHFACDGQTDACPDSCESDEDCISGFGCEGGKCIDRQEASCDGEHTITTSIGTTVDCRPYQCRPDGPSCLTQCYSTLDCSSGNVCDIEQRCVPYQSPSSESSCDCRSAGRSPGDGGAAVALLGLLSLALARRRLGHGTAM